MELTVYWTQFAEDKLEDIFYYHRYKAGAKTALKIVNQIVDATLNLDKNPLIGQKEELLFERIQEFRYIIEGHYKIIYWIDNLNKQVLISNVFDSRQNPDKLLRTP